MIASWFFGGGASGLAGQLRQAYQAKLDASTKEQVLAAELDIQRLENAVSMAQAANDDRWGATSIGRYLVVVPFGLWYSAIMLDSIFAFEWDVLALPAEVMELSIWLFPAIIVGDLGKSFFRGRR